MGGKRPTAELLAEVERLLREGGTANSIGAAVGRSRGSIVGLVHRHLAHVGFKGSAPWRMMRVGAIRKMLDTKRAKLKERAMMKPEDIEVVEDLGVTHPNWWTNQHPIPPEQLAAITAPITIATLREHHCRWPLWDDDVTDVNDKHFCGATASRGRYCAEHAKRMFAVPRR